MFALDCDNQLFVSQDVKGLNSINNSKNHCYCLVHISQSKFASFPSKNLPAKELVSSALPKRETAVVNFSFNIIVNYHPGLKIEN